MVDHLLEVVIGCHRQDRLRGIGGHVVEGSRSVVLQSDRANFGCVAGLVAVTQQRELLIADGAPQEPAVEDAEWSCERTPELRGGNTRPADLSKRVGPDPRR